MGKSERERWSACLESAKPGSKRVSVVVVEDLPQFRDALTEVINASPDICLAGVCRDLPVAMELVEHTCPQVLLVDLGLPLGSGMTLFKCSPIWWGARCTTVCVR